MCARLRVCVTHSPYSEENGIPVAQSKKEEAPFSCDANLLHISYEGNSLEDPWVEYQEHMFTRSVSPEDAPDKPTYIEIEFEGGDPVAINGEKMSPATMLAALNKYGGDNGIGRLDLVESRFVGRERWNHAATLSISITTCRSNPSS